MAEQSYIKSGLDGPRALLYANRASLYTMTGQYDLAHRSIKQSIISRIKPFTTHCTTYTVYSTWNVSYGRAGIYPSINGYTKSLKL